MMQSSVFLILWGLGFGVMVSGGVFTVFTAVGLIPRFADKTRTGGRINTYETCIILGALWGLIYSLYNPLATALLKPIRGTFFATIFVILYALATGMYVGCLALSIAEIFDAIPIMSSRFKLKRGIGIAIICFGIGKCIGSLYYWYHGIFKWKY